VLSGGGYYVTKLENNWSYRKERERERYNQRQENITDKNKRKGKIA